MTSHCITWHDTTQAITSHQMTWPSHDLTPEQTSRHQNTSLQSTKHHHHGRAEGSFTAKKWFGHRAGRSPCAHSIGKFFLCYIVLFLLETSAPGLSGHYWYLHISGQITVVLKPEVRGFGGFPYNHHHLGRLTGGNQGTLPKLPWHFVPSCSPHKAPKEDSGHENSIVNVSPLCCVDEMETKSGTFKFLKQPSN